MKGIIVVSGHGSYAKGIQSAVEVIAGHQDGVEYVDFEAGDNGSSLMEKMKSAIGTDTDSNILFICDLLGGTPFKTAVELAVGRDNIQVAAGCNLNGILEAIFQKDLVNSTELAELAVDSSKKSATRFVSQTPAKQGISHEQGDNGI